MEYIIHGRRPAAVFRFFEEISAIPRPSYHEERVADHLERFAAERGLACYRDGAHNVLITLPATPGEEGRAPLLFQGHTDMVCEKNGDVVHDFLSDPIKLRLDGKWLRAKGTTLGADNGIAVAMMLALLDGAAAVHPMLQCLFTTAEEVGLDGATCFDYSRIAPHSRMINLDSEALGMVTAGCAGGVRSDLAFTPLWEETEEPMLRVSIGGLAGGHSGENINQGRANANKLMGRLLSGLWQKHSFRLCRVTGGSKDNAIPRECTVTLALADADSAMELLTDTLGTAIASELGTDDRSFRLEAETVESGGAVMSLTDTRSILTLMASASNGVLAMSRDIPTLVEFSRNMGVIRTEEGRVDVVFSSRSSRDAQLEASMCELDLLAASLGASIRHYSRYPGWEYATKSPLRDAYLSAYRQVTGKEAQVNVIHAGLECGIISSRLPEMDIISVGPDMKDIHSPDEALDLDSVEMFWQTIEKLIEIL